MARYFVENKGEWNIFSTIVDDFLFDEFVCLTALKARLLYEEYKRIDEDINSLLTDRPKVNVMPYEEAMELRCKDESNSEKSNNSTISKMEQVDKDINVRSKDEPTTQTETQNSNLTFEKQTDCAWK